jgi:hypothetical protein
MLDFLRDDIGMTPVYEYGDAALIVEYEYMCTERHHDELLAERRLRETHIENRYVTYALGIDREGPDDGVLHWEAVWDALKSESRLFGPPKSERGLRWAHGALERRFGCKPEETHYMYVLLPVDVDPRQLGKLPGVHDRVLASPDYTTGGGVGDSMVYLLRGRKSRLV